MTLVFETPLPPTDKLVALCLADHAHDDGTHVFPAVATLAEKASLGTTATRSAIRRLEGFGILVQVAKGGGRGNPAEYRFDLARLINPTDSVAFPKPNAEEKPNGSGPQTQRLATETQRLTAQTQRTPVGESLEPSEPSGIVAAVAADEPPSVKANALATVYYNVQPLCNFPSVAGICRKALKAGHGMPEIAEALLRLADEGRGVTTETLRVELEGLPERKSRQVDRAAEILRGVADG